MSPTYSLVKNHNSTSNIKYLCHVMQKFHIQWGRTNYFSLEHQKRLRYGICDTLEESFFASLPVEHNI